MVCNFEEDENCNCLLCSTCELANDPRNPPWMKLFFTSKYKALTTNTPFPDQKPMLSFIEPFDKETFVFQFPTVKDVLQNFLVEVDGLVRPRMELFGSQTQYYVLWYVTSGRICANRNKTLFILWNHKAKPIDLKSISQLQNQDNCKHWKAFSSGPNFEFYYKLCEICQDVFDELVKILATYNRQRKYLKNHHPGFVIHRNLNNMPSFKTFRKDITNDFEHKKYVWTYATKKLGGNQGFAKPCEPTRLMLPCIHKMLVQYHSWLPNFRSKRQKQKTLEFST